MTAFEIFDPMGVPARSDEAFKEYVIPQIKILADHFYQEKKEKKELTEELECEWKNFKYNLLKLKDQVPQHILDAPQNKNLTAQTPTEWALQHMLSSRSTYQHFMPLLLYIAEVCLSLPVSNAWPERGASTLKRLKTRLRNSLKNDMLDSLMHVAINGPDISSGDCGSLIQDVVKKWCVMKRKKLAKGKPMENPTSDSDSPSVTQADIQQSQTLDNDSTDEYEMFNDEGDHHQAIEAIIAELNLTKDCDLDSHWLQDTDSDSESDY